MAIELEPFIRDVPDFPKKGIVFKDITPLLADRTALKHAIDSLSQSFAGRGISKVIGIESRGYIFAPAMALSLGCGFVPVRKPGKLPWRTRRASYELEYGTDSLEIHEDALAAGERALIVDDVIATGGTARAVGDLARGLGASVSAYAFLVELTFLNGREKLQGSEVLSLIRY